MQKNKKRLLIISFSNIATDPRVIKQVQLFVGKYEVTTCGFGETPPHVSKHIQLTDSPYWKYSKIKLLTKLYKSNYWKNENVQGALKVLETQPKFDGIIANDIETVPLALKLKSKFGVHADLHEYSPKLHEEILLWRLAVAPFIKWLCRKYLPMTKSITTVSNAIALKYEKVFRLKRVSVVPNATAYNNIKPASSQGKIKLVHSGAALTNRGILELVRAVKQSRNDVSLDLYLMPNDPAYIELLKAEIKGTENIRLLDPVAYSKLIETLNLYDVGIHVIPPVNFNNKSALPNKFFDYVQARLGILIGPSREMLNLLEKYQLGLATEDFSVNAIASAIDSLTQEKVNLWKSNSDKAAMALSAEEQISNWEISTKTLLEEI